MSRENGHWYAVTGEPKHFIPKKDGSGTRPTTLADAKRNGWLPSVTHILKTLDKPALRDWLIRNAVMAVVTAPDMPGENLDAKITRVLDVEKQQDQESQMAMDRGTEIHAALEAAFSGRARPVDIGPWMEPVFNDLSARGKTIGTEIILVGDGYAGKADLAQECGGDVWIWDFKTTKKLPTRGAWQEHVLQLSGYAAAFERRDASRPIHTGNVYISTVEPGKYCICEHEPWGPIYSDGFVPLVRLWQYLNNYKLT